MIKPTGKYVRIRREMRKKKQSTTDSSPVVRAAVPDNRFYIGDCLPVLAEMAAEYGQFADLVYLDPPFNSRRFYNHVFHGAKRTLPQKVAFHDSWKWADSAKRDFREFTENEAPGTPAAALLKGMQTVLEKRDESTLAYLTYMTRRLARIRAVMKPTASVYLHCDPTASHYLKLAMDAVFGRDSFCNEIAWCYTGPGKAARWFPRNHDVLLFYAKNARQNVFNAENIRVPYKGLKTQHREGGRSGGIGGRLTSANVDAYRRRGKIPEDYWLETDGFTPVGRIKGERLGYPTQKPAALLRRIVEASSNPGDLALDPFCGCGTTIAACHELGRRFVGIDIARSAAQVVAGRMRAQYPEFGRLVIGDKSPANVSEWGRLLPDADADGEVPAWARFQYDAIAAIPKAEQIEGPIQRTARLGVDGGVDGLVHLELPTGARSSIVIQVKRKKQPSVTDVADTIAAVNNNNAFMGLLITLNNPTAGMLERAEAESTRQLGGRRYPKVAILTYEEVKAGKYAEAIPYEYAVDPQSGSQSGLDLSAKSKGE